MKTTNRQRRGPAGILLARRERGRTALQAAERSAKRAKAEKALRDEEARLALIEAQKVCQIAFVAALLLVAVLWASVIADAVKPQCVIEICFRNPKIGILMSLIRERDPARDASSVLWN